MTDVGIQTDELYINGIPLRELLQLDIPQTHYLKMLDNNDPEADDNINAGSDSDTSTDTEEETFTQEDAEALYSAIFDYIDYIVTPNISLFSDPHFHKKVEFKMNLQITLKYKKYKKYKKYNKYKKYKKHKKHKKIKYYDKHKHKHKHKH